MEPKDTTTNDGYKGFTNAACTFLPCHQGVKRDFNCLFCYCPLNAHECPGQYQVFIGGNGVARKDCSACTLPHDGYRQSWNFIQKWIEKPVPWRGWPQARPLACSPETALPDAPPPAAGPASGQTGGS